MSPAATNGTSLPDAYKASLEQHIQSGGWRLVCQDEDLYKHVKDILSGQDTRESTLCLNFDALSVMEESLSCKTTSRTGLRGLAKAFEVLELASLNLYLYPWRKEYKIIKMYSGMFIHQVKPVLTMSQVETLFGHLGYRLSKGTGGEEELCLGAISLLPEKLLHLAYSFFLARCECNLLLDTSTPKSLQATQQAKLNWELSMVQERRRGHSLEMALYNVKRSLGASRYLDGQEVASSSNALEEELDLYTVEGNSEADCHVGGGLLVQSKDSTERESSRRKIQSSSAVASDTTSPLKSQRCISTMTYKLASPTSPLSVARQELPRLVEEQILHITGNGNMDVSKKPPDACSCIMGSGVRCDWLCVQCNACHSYTCDRFRHCQDMGHSIAYPKDPNNPEATKKDTAQVGLPDPKDKHMSPSLMVREPPGFPERHSCLGAGEKPLVTCHTCHRSHEYLCEEAQGCAKADHNVEYQLETDSHMPFHSCCPSDGPNPNFACRVCRVFHSASCPTGIHCKQAHDICKLKGACEYKECPLVPEILCRHCCAQFCRECWYKSPLSCLCGKPYGPSSPV